MENKKLTIPNIISLIRIALIPVFIYIYFGDFKNCHRWAFVIIILSALSDMADGIIARRFNMISDLGKVLDPIADKLTQVAIVVILCFKHKTLIPVFCVLFTKELLTACAAAFWFKKGMKPVSARWWGKLSTALLYTSFMYYMIIDIIAYDSVLAVDISIMLAIIFCLLFSMCGYIKTVLLDTKHTQV
ncbi:MAG: CDP-alcohol phosphatidyltransferase family protein [Clostridia bacterium]|nr:CDP-alcohol phosphatidyltransferase family protein [Clostridia bacterium]